MLLLLLQLLLALSQCCSGSGQVSSTQDAEPSSMHPSRMDPALLQQYLQRLFAIADENNDGVLQDEELWRLLSLSGFEFDESQATDTGCHLMRYRCCDLMRRSVCRSDQ